MNFTKLLFWPMYAFNVLMLVLERKITMLGLLPVALTPT